METDAMPSKANGLLAESIKTEKSGQAEGLRATSTEFHELAVKIEPLQSLPAEIEHSHIAPVVLISQAHECHKAELISEDGLLVEASHALKYNREHSLREHSEDQDQHTSGPQTSNDACVYTKIEFISDEEFLDEDKGSNSAQVSRKSDPFGEDKQGTNASLVDPQTSNDASIHPTKDLMSEQQILHEESLADLAQANEQGVIVSTPEQSASCEEDHYYPKGAFRKHMRVPWNMTFKCQLCPRSFRRPGYLMLHMKKHSREEFACQACGEKFSTRSCLNSHRRVHHSKTYGCRECGVAFKNNSNLKMHMVRKHFGEVQHCAQNPKATNTAPVQIKTELASNEEFLEEDAVAESVHGSQQSASKSTAEDTVTCELCHNSYPKELFSTHMRLVHREQTSPFKCDLCLPARCFRRPEDLRRHMAAHAKEGKGEFVCWICGEIFSARTSLKNHTRLHAGRNYKFFYCPVCGAAFKNIRSQKEHMLRRHLGEAQQYVPKPQTTNADAVQTKRELASDKEFLEGDAESPQEGQKKASDSVSCGICHNSYPKELLSTHMRLAHTERTHKCELCPKSYTSSKSLKQHMRTHAKDGVEKKTYKCELCAKSFTKLSYLNEHTKTHAKDRKAGVACRVCGKIFSARSTLYGHRLKAHAGRTYGCQVCGAAFSYEKSRNRHMLSQHSDETQQFFVEPQTAKADSVQIATELASHEVEKDGEASATVNEQTTSIRKAFKCKLCPRSFLLLGHLNQHLVIHDKKEFACQTCGQTFSALSVLNNHRRIHDTRTYECSVCGAAFKQKRSRNWHMLRRHPGEAQQLVPKAPTANSDSVQTKTEFVSDEEFLEEDAEGSRQTLSISTADESVSCGICHNSYPKELFGTHMRVAHCEKKHKCELCPRSFRRPVELKRHMNRHANDRKREFACPCGKSFLARSSLIFHKRKFHESSPKQS